MKAHTISNAFGAVGKESKVAVAVMHLLSLLYKSTTTIPLQFMREASLWELCCNQPVTEAARAGEVAVLMRNTSEA